MKEKTSQELWAEYLDALYDYTLSISETGLGGGKNANQLQIKMDAYIDKRIESKMKKFSPNL